MSGTLRTLLVTSSFPRFSQDTAGAFLVPLAQALKSHAGDLHVLAPHGEGPLEPSIGGIRVTRVRYAPTHLERLFYGAGAPIRLQRELGRWKGAPLSLAAVLAMARGILHQRRTTDVVFAQWLIPAGLAGALARNVGGPPLCVGVHGSDVRWLGSHPAGKGLACWIASQAGALWAPSRELAHALHTMVKRPVHVLPLPVTCEPPADPLGRFDVGFLGRLIPEKGVDLLLAACAAAGLSVVVAGDGPTRTRLEHLARAHGIRASFLGWLAPQERRRLWASIELLAVPSIGQEGAPSVVAEAQAHGVPVLASAVGGLPEMVPTDCLVFPGDVDAWTSALLHAVSTPSWRTRVVEDGLERSRARRLGTLGPCFAQLLGAVARGQQPDVGWPAEVVEGAWHAEAC